MLEDKFEANKKFLEKEFSSLVNLYKNKYVLVVDEGLAGSFDTYEAAANEGINNYGPESGFVVQFMTENEPANFIATAIL